MAQSDYVIGANPSGLAMRTEINTIFDSILTNNSGSTAPTVTSALMMWVDTSNATYYYLKMRNHNNTAWVTLGTYTVATKVYTSYTEDTIKLTGNQDILGIKNFTNKILSPNISYKDTPIIITSWSYSGTTITLNVASHTFVTGDYIEVSGLTSTTNPANGIQVVTSVTATAIVFTLGATPTGTAGVSSATVKGYATINGRVADITAVKNVTGSRLSGVNYPNTSGKTKQVVIVASSDYPLVSVGGEVISGISTGVRTITFPVPNGLLYSVTIITGTFISWSETI